MAARSEQIDATPIAERELVLTRIFDAPRELVFSAWTEPEHVRQWFGPHCYTNPVCEMDVRPGGTWFHVMRSPQGIEFPMKCTYQEVVEPERLVFTQIVKDSEGGPLIEARTTLTFEEHEGCKTKFTMRTRAIALAEIAKHMLAGMEEGWKQTLERLTTEIIVMDGRAALSTPTDSELVTTRLFDAPRELVFKMWTDPKHIGQWWGPNGFTTTTLEMDARTGGGWRLIMHGPDGRDYKHRIVYVEVIEPERLVYKNYGEERDQEFTFQSVVTFDDEGGKTRLTMTMIFESQKQRARLIEKYGADKGAIETIERLGKHVAAIKEEL